LISRAGPLGACKSAPPVYRRAQCLGEGDRVVDGPVVHVKQPGLFGEAVVVELSDPNVAGAQRLDDLLSFGVGEDEVAIDGGAVTADGLEVDRGGQVQRGLRQHVPVLDNGVIAGNAVLEQPAVGFPLRTNAPWRRPRRFSQRRA
jgi:hypothetical protein